MPRWSWRRRRAAPAPVTVACYRPAEGVSAATRDGRTVLLHLGRERYFGLDEVGTAVWAQVAAGTPVDGIARRIAAEYAAPLATVTADVSRYLEALRTSGLVTPVPEHG